MVTHLIRKIRKFAKYQSLTGSASGSKKSTHLKKYSSLKICLQIRVNFDAGRKIR